MTTQGAGCFFSAHLLFQEVLCSKEFPDDSTVWGVHCPKTLAPSPRSPGGFTSATRLASTPSHKLLVGPVHALEDKGVGHCSCRVYIYFIIYHKQKGHCRQILLFEG